MRINELLWPRERVEHIARHGVTPEEVEQVCSTTGIARKVLR